jgi:iron complex outermembrane recepter protein
MRNKQSALVARTRSGSRANAACKCSSESCPPTAIAARWRRSALAAVLISTLGVGAKGANDVPSPPAVDLSRLSLEELSDIDVTSVSKRSEPLAGAAAAVYVITREEIRRSGATSLPEALRLAPNLQVARVDSSQYAISARGFNSTTANKLLVMIDGRTVYTPLYSGVFWDVQDVMLEDIERIEVISGPGGTLWGSNAVNGVINVITRSAKDTQGSLVSLGAGNEERAAAARHGGKLGEDGSYRIYAKAFSRDDTQLVNGTSAQDSWNKRQAGFRFDRGRSGDALTVQGDAYDGSIEQPHNSDNTISGGDLLGRWNRQLGEGSLQVQAYFDHTRRVYPGTFRETLNTSDLEAQHDFRWGADHEIVWGGGYRSSRDDVQNTPLLAFLPAQKTLSLANVFAQDTIALSERLHLTLGGKLERNNYTGLEVQPNARLALNLPSQGLLWSAVSRAVRTPSRIDRDFFFPGSAPFVIAGGPDFVSEKLVAYEAGYRLQASPVVSFSISTFYNVYDDLRTIEPTGGRAFVLANKMEGETYGVEAWGGYKLNEQWRVTLGYSALRKMLRLKPGSGDTTSLAAAGTDPSYQFFARSAVNLPHNVDFDLVLRAINGLPSQGVPQYTAFDAQVGWLVSRGVEVSLTGNNLFDSRHREFGTTATGSEIERSAFVKLRLEF